MRGVDGDDEFKNVSEKPKAAVNQFQKFADKYRITEQEILRKESCKNCWNISKSICLFAVSSALLIT